MSEAPVVGNGVAESPAAPAVKRRKRRSRRARAAQMREAAKRGSAASARAPKARPMIIRDDRLEEGRPSLPALDPLEAAQEEARHAKEGNLKLAKALEILRAGLETIVVAEEDHETGLPVTAKELRTMAVSTLDLYSASVGQNWRKAKLSGATRAGTKGNKPVHEAQMGMPPAEE